MPTAQARRRRQIEQIWLGRFTLGLLLGLFVWVLVNNNASDNAINQNRKTLCAAARILTASPTVYIPEFETREQFGQILKARAQFLALVRGIDCSVVLAGTVPTDEKKGGGHQSSPTQGSQLLGGHRSPPPTDK